MKQFLIKLISAHTEISSKRVCGILGWIVSLIILIYCSIRQTQAPDMIDTVLYCCMGLLGRDSITSIWRKQSINMPIVDESKQNKGVNNNTRNK